MESNQFTLHVIFNNKIYDLSLDTNKTLNDVKKMIESQLSDVSNRQYNLLTKNGQSISGNLSSPFFQCSSSFLDDLISNGSIEIHVSLISELNSTAMMNSIDSILSMPSSNTSIHQEKDDILDGFDNLLDLKEFDGMLKSTEIKNNSSSNNLTQTTQKTTNPIDLLSELEKLEDQNKKGLVDKQIGISDQDFDRILGLNSIDEKQKELERQRKLYEEQQNLAQQQLLLQQQQYAMQTSANLVIPVENQNNRLATKYQGYDPNVTFVLDDDDDDDWVPRQEDLIRKEKQREKERKEREKREKKMKKKNKKTKKGSKEEPNVQVDDKMDPISPRGEPSTPIVEEPISPIVEEPISPRAEEPISPRAEEPISPRVEEPISPRVEEPSHVESSPSHVENQTNDDPLPPPEDDDIVSPPKEVDVMPPPKEDIVLPPEDDVDMPPPKEDIILPSEESVVSPSNEVLSTEAPSSPKDVPNVSSSIDDISNPGNRKSQWISRKPDTNLERKDFLLSRGSVVIMDFKNYFQEENKIPSSSKESVSKSDDDPLPPPMDDDPLPPPKDDDPLPPPMDDDPLPPPMDDDPLPPPMDDDPLPPPTDDPLSSENEKHTSQYVLPDIKPFNIVYEPLTVPTNDPKPSSDNSVKNEQDDLFQALDNLLFETDSKMEEQIDSVQKLQNTSEDTLKFLDEAISFLDS